MGSSWRPPSTAMKAPPATSVLGGTPWCFHFGCLCAYKTIEIQNVRDPAMTIGMTHRLTSDPDMASTPGHLAMSWSEPYPGDAIPYRRAQPSHWRQFRLGRQTTSAS